MEIYCIMRNLILALWFYNNKVRYIVHVCAYMYVGSVMLKEYMSVQCVSL